MTKLQRRGEAPSQPPPGGRLFSPETVILMMMMSLLMLFAAAAPAAADLKGASTEKGNHPMQPAAAMSLKDVPPLDRTQPGRVETFTFGLG
jgi:hypothetical protein